GAPQKHHYTLNQQVGSITCEVSIKATNNPTTSEIFEVNYPFLLTLQKMRESKVFFFLYFHLYVFFYML
ncbi:hypothetical protein ACRFAH_29035, partial [Klebsiella pneumoniae]